MRCPTCKGPTCVIDSRESQTHGVRRRRLCQKCGARWTTSEVIANSQPRDAELRALVVAIRSAARIARDLELPQTRETPRRVKRGRPPETGAGDFERCETCGALVWRGELGEHECSTSADGIERLERRLDVGAPWLKP